MEKRKTSMQIVDLSGDKPKHVTRVYSSLAPNEVLKKIYQSLRGHLVFGKNGEELAQIREENAVPSKSRGEEVPVNDQAVDQNPKDGPRKRKRKG